MSASSSATAPGDVGLRAYAHVLAVPDLDRSTRYFCDALGFKVDWEDKGNWTCLSRGGARVMLGHCPDATPPRELGDHSYFAYFHIDDVDAFHAEIAGRGAEIMFPPADKPWGLRELGVRTPDGHRMVFGKLLPHA
jgi:catechol 2,3-dioxygenase-like lactoylglutathione lyase family enzyme